VVIATVSLPLVELIVASAAQRNQVRWVIAPALGACLIF
jgi:hypothetical protein